MPKAKNATSEAFRQHRISKLDFEQELTHEEEEQETWNKIHHFLSEAEVESIFTGDDEEMTAFYRAMKRLDKINLFPSSQRLVVRAFQNAELDLDEATPAEILGSTTLIDVLCEIELARLQKREPLTKVTMPYIPDPDAKWKIWQFISGRIPSVSDTIITVLEISGYNKRIAPPLQPVSANYDIESFSKDFNTVSLHPITPDIVADWVNYGRLSNIANHETARRDLSCIDGLYEFLGMNREDTSIVAQEARNNLAGVFTYDNTIQAEFKRSLDNLQKMVLNTSAQPVAGYFSYFLRSLETYYNLHSEEFAHRFITPKEEALRLYYEWQSGISSPSPELVKDFMKNAGINPEGMSGQLAIISADRDQEIREGRDRFAHTAGGDAGGKPGSAKLAEIIIAAHEKSKLTTQEVAIRTNCYETTIKAFEAGYLVPGPRNMAALCKALNIDTDSAEFKIAVELATKHQLYKYKTSLNRNIIEALADVNIDTNTSDLYAAFAYYTGNAKSVKEVPGKISLSAIRDRIDVGRAITAHNDPRISQKLGLPFMRTNDINDDAFKADWVAINAFKEITLERIDLIADATAKIIDDPVYQELLSEAVRDICLRRVPRKSINTLCQEYMASGGDKLTFGGFLQYVAKSWRMHRAEHARLAKYSRDVANEVESAVTNMNYHVKEVVDNMDALTGIKTSEQTLEILCKLRNGTHTKLEAGELADFALAVIGKKEAKIEDFPNNPIVKYLQRAEFRHSKDPAAFIDKAQIPVALLFLCLESINFRLSQFLINQGLTCLLHASAGEHFPSVEEYQNGKRTIVVTNTGTPEKPELTYNIVRETIASGLAAGLAPIDKATQDKLTAAFLVRPKYLKPSDVIKGVYANNLDIETGFLMLKMQIGATNRSISDAAKCSDTVTGNIEKGSNIRHREHAFNIAKEICRLYKEPACIDELALIFMGKRRATAVADIESKIERAYTSFIERNYPDDLKTLRPEDGPIATPLEIISDMVEHVCGPDRYSDFLEKVIYKTMTGKTREGANYASIQTFRRVGKFDNEGFPFGLAKHAGLSDEAAIMMAKLACQTAICYVPQSISALREREMEDISGSERVDLMAQLLANSNTNLGRIAKKDEAGYRVLSLIMTYGHVPDAGGSSNKKKSIAKFISSIIPDAFPEDRLWLDGLINTGPCIKADHAKLANMLTETTELAA